MAGIESSEQTPKKEIHLDIVKKRLDELAEEQKAKLGERTISDEDITRFGDEEKSDSDRFEILKRTKTPMDIYILMTIHNDIWCGDYNYPFIKNYIPKECNENIDKILPNIIQAAAIHIPEFYDEYNRRNLIELYNVIIKTLKGKYNTTKQINQVNQVNSNIAINISNSVEKTLQTIGNNNEKNINDTLELYSRIYIKLLECTESTFTNACNSRGSYKNLPEYNEGINNLLINMKRNIIQIKKMRPRIKDKYENLISLKEEIEMQKLIDKQKDNREYLFLNDEYANEI